MSPGHLRYYGSYRYASRESLERAVAAAWSRFDEEEIIHPSLASLNAFVKHGDRLHVDLTLSAGADVQFAAASMFETLAEDALEGVVEARHGSDHLDFYVCGDDD